MHQAQTHMAPTRTDDITAGADPQTSTHNPNPHGFHRDVTGSVVSESQIRPESPTLSLALATILYIVWLSCFSLILCLNESTSNSRKPSQKSLSCSYLPGTESASLLSISQSHRHTVNTEEMLNILLMQLKIVFKRNKTNTLSVSH